MERGGGKRGEGRGEGRREKGTNDNTRRGTRESVVCMLLWQSHRRTNACTANHSPHHHLSSGVNPLSCNPSSPVPIMSTLDVGAKPSAQG